MQIRYFTEIYLFFILACYFQYNVYSFSTEYNVFQRRYDLLSKVYEGYGTTYTVEQAEEIVIDFTAYL